MAFKIIRNDITKVAADAIVNTANPDPRYGSGTDGAIYAAAGADELLAERAKIGTMEVGEAKATPAFALHAQYIIHTVGPVWGGGQLGEFDDLRKCYENSLRLASNLKCDSIAFPLISTGVYGFPKDKALQIAVSAFSDFLTDHDMDITLVVFDPKSYELSGKIFSGIDEFIDNNYVSDQIVAEYGDADRYEKLTTSSRRRGSLFGRFTGSVFGSHAKADAAHDEEPIAAMKESSEPMFCAMAAAPEPSESRKKRTPRTLDEAVAHISDTWQESMLRLIDERGFTDIEVYKRANVDRKLFSKIRSNRDYQPKKITAVAFALALRLNLDETKDMLARAGYALSPSSRFDLIIEYFIQNGVYDTYSINLALFEYDQPLLGA